jgi:hypothetical protein
MAFIDSPDVRTTLCALPTPAGVMDFAALSLSTIVLTYTHASNMKVFAEHRLSKYFHDDIKAFNKEGTDILKFWNTHYQTGIVIGNKAPHTKGVSVRNEAMHDAYHR